MPGFGELVQKTFYLGVGLASYAGEKAGGTLQDMRSQGKKLVKELVDRGEMTSEEAQRILNDMMGRSPAAPTNTSPADQPRTIEILDDDEPPRPSTALDTVNLDTVGTEQLRQQVDALRQELNRLKREGKG